MQTQKTFEVPATCVAARMEFQAAEIVMPAGSAASEDGVEEWQMVRRSAGRPAMATDIVRFHRAIGAIVAYSYTVPSLPDGAPAMATDIVRFVKFVAGDNGQHFFNHVALHRCNDNWIFFGVGDTGVWRSGKWTWRKQEPEVITLTYARKHGSEVKTRSFERNVLGLYVTNRHTSAGRTKVLSLVPRSILA